MTDIQLSKYTTSILLHLMMEPIAISIIHPGAADELLRLGFIEEVSLPSPFKALKGGKCPHVRITDAGRTWYAMTMQPKGGNHEDHD